MKQYTLSAFYLLNLLWSINAFADDPSLQVHYASHLLTADSYIDVTNTGAGTSASTPFASGTGNLCVNVYAFAADERLVSCCSCLVTPNALVSLSAKSDLVSNTLTGEIDDSIMVKLLATTSGGNDCNAATAGVSSSLAKGMLAWSTSVHTAPPGSSQKYHMTETPFVPATLSVGELTRFTQMCAFMQVNGSGQGICRSCRQSALGGSYVQ